MNWYIGVLKKYTVFDGRARRMEYWMFVLFNFIFMLVAMLLDALIGTSFDGGYYGGYYGVIYLLYALFVLIPGLAVQVRRMHDQGKSGWWLFINFVPFIGSIWYFILLCTDSELGANQYGPYPKEGLYNPANPY